MTLRIGAAVRQQREAVGLSQTELATQLHVTRQTVSKWELDKRYPDIATLVALATVLHCDVRVLLGMKQKVQWRHLLRWRAEDKEVKWYAGGSERAKLAIAKLTEIMAALPPTQASLRALLQTYYDLLMAQGTSVPYVLTTMNLEAAGLMHKQGFLLPPVAEARYKELMRLSNIRYR
ncbi:helix-turn-helix domain-containing protein [Lacticaseibacillus absianus]|uniref:helix-turn-helix domain-containing protein n=1 Tax=Lacticaseibacillus absianus TaxID=2729623 RepID=UPI0015C725B5|nr:helix-turn-helix transcriptional regulator [Lacticaseibacillus absianus]